MRLELDEYERDNLASLLRAVVDAPGFQVAHTGDWTCQILYKLEELDADPSAANRTPEQLGEELDDHFSRS